MRDDHGRLMMVVDYNNEFKLKLYRASSNKALKFALAVWGQALEVAKAHSFTGASTPRGIPFGSGSGTS
jgi:hypothetical protein